MTWDSRKPNWGISSRDHSNSLSLSLLKWISPPHGQHPAVQLQEIAVGQAALFLVAFGPGIAEVDIDAVHLAGGEEVRQAGGVAVHKLSLIHI